MADFSSAVTIEELSDKRETLRAVRLVGPALPHMGAEWATENALVTTWYPGNPDEATQQVLGPRELPSTWTGEWKRTLMGKFPSGFVDADGGSVSVTAPQFLRDILDDFFRRGQRLRVTWEVDSDDPSLAGKIVREGRAKTWKFPHTRMTDIEWSIEFHWLGRGAKVAPVTATREDNVPSAVGALNQALLTAQFLTQTKIVQVKSTVTKSATKLTLGQLEALANAPNLLVTQLTRAIGSTVNDFKRVTDIVAQVRSIPTQVAKTVTDFAANTRQVLQLASRNITREPAESFTKKTSVVSILRSANYFNTIDDSVATATRRSQELLEKVQQAASANTGSGQVSVSSTTATRAGAVARVHVVVPGDTPEGLSARFYGTPDRAVDILRANHLPWHSVLLNVGSVLVIPALTAPRAA